MAGVIFGWANYRFWLRFQPVDDATDDNTVVGHDGNKKKGDHGDTHQGEIEDFPELRFRLEFRKKIARLDR